MNKRTDKEAIRHLLNQTTPEKSVLPHGIHVRLHTTWKSMAITDHTHFPLTCCPFVSVSENSYQSSKKTWTKHGIPIEAHLIPDGSHTLWTG
jgi:hypothetical protein